MSAAQKPLRTDAEVVGNAREGGTNLRLRLRVPAEWPGSSPGQFVMLSPGPLCAAERFDPLLPRPMAIYRSRRLDDGPEATGGPEDRRSAATELDILYKVTGRGTALLAEAVPGQRVRVVGPLGCGFRAPAAGEAALLVGGGTGIASLYDLAAQAAGLARVVVLLGARNAADLMGVDDFRALGVELGIATDDGSQGRPGPVTDLLEGALNEHPEGRVYACGPTPMMRRAAEIAAAHGARCAVSLENRMACGFGVCLGCAVPRRGEGFHLVCRDGPVFEADDLAWEAQP